MKNIVYPVCVGLILSAIAAGSTAIIKVGVLEAKVQDQKETIVEVKQDIREIKSMLIKILARVNR